MNSVELDKKSECPPVFQAESLDRQADAMCTKGEWAKAGDLLQLAVQQRRLAHGDNDPTIALTLDKLAVTLMERRLPAQAAIALADAEKIMASNYYEGHSVHAPLLEHHADCLMSANKLPEAEALLKRALEIYTKTMTMENRDTLRSIYKLALIYLMEDKPADAALILEKAMKHVDTPLGPCAEFRFQLARAYVAQDKLDEARQLLELAIAEFKQRNNYGGVADCLDTLISLPETDRTHQSFKDETAKYRLLSRFSPYYYDKFPATLLRA